MSRSSRQAISLSKKYETDPIIVEDLIELVGKASTEAILMMSSNDLRSTARVNLLKTSRPELINDLSNEGIIARAIPEILEGIELFRGKDRIGSSKPYLRGEVMPQGLGSMLAVAALDPKPNEMILDMAAAPGGKSCFIAERMENKGKVICNDVSRKRMRSLIFNLTRHGIEIAEVVNKNGLDIHIEGLDRIMLDSPCTGAGLLVSKPERRRSRNLNDYLILQKTQQNLLRHAISLLKPGGQLVYATCSISILENEEVIKPQLSRVKVLPLTLSGKVGSTSIDPIFSNALRLYPDVNGCDGFFVIKMEKR